MYLGGYSQLSARNIFDKIVFAEAFLLQIATFGILFCIRMEVLILSTVLPIWDIGSCICISVIAISCFVEVGFVRLVESHA